MNDGPVNPEPNAPDPALGEWLKFDDELKKYGLLIGAISSVVITSVFGPQVLYVLLGLAAVGIFALNPDLNLERMLYGGVAGFLMVGPTFGPLGIIGGAALGHYVGKRYDQLAHKADQVITAVATVARPIRAVGNAVGNAPSSMVSGMKKGYQAAKSGIVDFFSFVDKTLQDELEARVSPIDAPLALQTAEEIREQVLTPHKVVQFSQSSVKQPMRDKATQTQAPQAANDMENPAPVEPRRRRKGIWGMDFPLTMM